MKKAVLSAVLTVSFISMSTLLVGCGGGGGGGSSSPSTGTNQPSVFVGTESITIKQCQPQGQPLNLSQVVSLAQYASNPRLVDSFFDNAEFIGAVNPSNDWTDGWTFGLGKNPSMPSCTTATVIQGDITGSVTLESGKCYRLKGVVRVKSGGVLNIQPGVLIYGDKTGIGSFDSLNVERGGKIIAEGTKEKPILFVGKRYLESCDTSSGQWGGINIAGFASTNTGSTENQFEADKSLVYGGNSDNDSSGSLKYVVLAFGGAEVAPDEEVNGLTLLATGSGTKIEYVQVYNNADDGVEWFGGTANAKYLVLIGNEDDNIDTDQGYRGNVQYVYIRQTKVSSNDPRGIEADGLRTNYNATPYSFLRVANITIESTNSSAHEAIMLRRGTDAQLINVFITGPRSQACIRINNNATYQRLSSRNVNSPVFMSVIINNPQQQPNCSTTFRAAGDTGEVLTFTNTDIQNMFNGYTNNRVIQ
ncbi:MAG: hypothetical protein N2Z80_04215 [Hydrogenothermaceae bacterium]|nr:hypothetical protein [Hydrogenothermaceae bacterium]